MTKGYHFGQLVTETATPPSSTTTIPIGDATDQDDLKYAIQASHTGISAPENRTDDTGEEDHEADQHCHDDGEPGQPRHQRPRQISTAHATASPACARSRFTIEPLKSTSSSMENEPNAAKLAIVDEWNTSLHSANSAGPSPTGSRSDG